jgi:hypothetical protein
MGGRRGGRLMECHNILLGDGNTWRCLDSLYNSDHSYILLALIIMVILLLIGEFIVSRRQEHEEIELLKDIDHTEHEILEQLRKPQPRLSSIKIAFTKGDSVMAEGPVILAIGQKATASIDGFDQTGAAWTGVIPPVTFSIDNTAIATSTPNADGVTDALLGVSAGVANLTASLTTKEGKILSDTETVTVPAVVPVLSSIKINTVTS